MLRNDLTSLTIRDPAARTPNSALPQFPPLCYYFYSEEEPNYLLAIYGKDERSDLDAAQKKAARAFVDYLKSSLKRKRQ